MRTIKQSDVNTYYTTYETNGQTLTYGVAIRDNGQIIPLSPTTGTSNLIPSTATDLSTAAQKEDQSWVKIEQYLRQNDERNLGSSPSLQ